MKLRIVVDRNRCEANAVCVAEAPEVFQLSDSNEMAILEEAPAAERLADVQRAVARCPRAALALVDE